jgi:hypothetical protein
MKPYNDCYDVPKAIALLDQWTGDKELFGWYVFGSRAISA